MWNAALLPLLLAAVTVAGAQIAATVAVTPSPVNLSYQIGGLNNQSAQQAVTLFNAGAAAVPYLFGTPTAGGCAWIAVSPSSGTIPAYGNAQATVSYNCPAGLPAGSYSGSIPISVVGGTLPIASIPVNLLVSVNPLLIVQTAPLSFSYELGSNPPAGQSITPVSSAVVADAISGQMPITASASTANGGSWLVVTTVAALSTGSPIWISVNPANLAPGTYAGTVTVAPGAGAMDGNGAQSIPVSLTVGNGPSLQVSGDYGSYSGPIPPPTPIPLTSLSIPYQIGQAAAPLQGVTVSSSTGDPLDYSVTSAEATCGSVAWLALGGYTSGVAPGQYAGFTVYVQNLGGLPVGECNGTITVSATNPATGNAALGSPLSIPVTLYVSDSPLLSVYAPYLGFTLPVGGAYGQYAISVNSTQPGMNFTPTASWSTSSGGNWLGAGFNGSNNGTLLSVSANPGALPAGTYNGTVTVAATESGAANSPLTIPVMLTLVPGEMVLSASSMAFTYVVGGSNPPAQSVLLTANVSANFEFSAVANSGAMGGNWLSVTPASGGTTGSISVSVNPSGLSPGTYSGSVVVASPNVGVSAVTIPVTLTVAAETISASPPPSAGLTFTLPQGGYLSPLSQVPVQTITLSSAPASVAFTASAATLSGGNWLTVTPGNGTTTGTVQVSVIAGSLLAGTYTGTVTITAPGASGSPITYPVTFIVQPDEIIDASPSAIGFGFTVNAPLPAPQTVQVGFGSTNGIEPTSPLFYTATASATTNSGASWLSVSQFANTYLPSTISVSVNPVGLAEGSYTGAILISSPQLPSATIPVTLTVTGPAPPLISGLANAASNLGGAATSVSPGEEVAIYGSNFGPSQVIAATPQGGAYSTTLSNTQVFFDGVAAPVIAVTNGQVDVMVPYGVFGQATTAVQVSYFGVTSAPAAFYVGPPFPGAYTLNQTGKGQGAILNQNSSVNGATNPAAPGSVVSIYMTGTGVTSPPSITGRLAPTDGTGLNTPVQPVIATVGGLPAQVKYAGSAPGLVYGVTQVDVEIPPDAPAGNLLIVVTVGPTSGASQTGVTVAVN